MSDRPDQLDVQIAFAINKIRQQVDDARCRLGLPLVEYPDVEWWKEDDAALPLR